MAISFKEQQRTVLYHDYMVFVCGVDISPWVQSLEITYTDRNGPGSADIVLTNPFNQWILTSDNFNNIYRNTNDRFSEKAKLKIYNRKQELSQQFFIRYNTSRHKSSKDPKSAMEDFQRRYSFGPGSCIFSKFDTVKIFIKNPYDSPSTDRWIPAFTGTIGNRPVTSNYVTGASSVSLHCYDIRATMTGMRIAVNGFNNSMWQTSEGGKKNTIFIDSDAAGFFKDYYPTNNQRVAGTDHIFSGFSFVDMVSLIVTGRYNWVSPSSKSKSGPNGVVGGQGTGFFSPGKVIKYSNPKNTQAIESGKVGSLESWDNLCLFGTKSDFWTKKECVSIGENSFWQDKHSPLHGQMHFLIPASGLQISGMIRTSFEGLNNIMATPDWTDRFSLISKVCQQIDYEWSVTGNGDIIFEFPMYDFLPENFGGHNTVYTVEKHLESDMISEEEGEVISGLESQSLSPSLVQGEMMKPFAQAAQAQAVLGQLTYDLPVRAVVYSNVLASKYGVKLANQTFTGVANLQALEKISAIEFSKRLADANKLSMTFTYRPYLRPNRPLLHQEKNRVGRITSVRLSLPSYDQSPAISVSLNCVKTPLLKNSKIEYQTIAGGEAMPISYNAIYERPDKTGNPDTSGVIIQSCAVKDRQTSSNPTK
jgi:hypothetical protein